MAIYQMEREQIINASIDDVWDFMASPHNLKKITPEYMGFDIMTKNMPDKIYEGLIISYIVKPVLGLKMNWVTEITHVKEKSYFVDEQKIGPYAFWQHQHIIQPHGHKVLMKDIVSYKPPFAIFGQWANTLFIEKQLNTIFDYRNQVIKTIFPL